MWEERNISCYEAKVNVRKNMKKGGCMCMCAKGKDFVEAVEGERVK